MALKVQSSFSTGELDPVLQERTTLDKFNSGLATLRNAVIGKSGRIVSRGGRKFYRACKNASTGDENRAILFALENSPYFLEWGHEYVRQHNISDNTYVDTVHDFTWEDLPYVQFVSSGPFVYVFRDGKKLKKYYVNPSPSFLSDSDIFGIPAAPTYVSETISGAGYACDYLFTAVIGGQEGIISIARTGKAVPITTGTQNSFTYNCGPVFPSEMRVYRRPASGGIFGFIGSTSAFALVTGNYHGTFIDLGQGADYTHEYPQPSSTIAPILALSRTGTVYQQRLLITRIDNSEGIEASRTGFHNNFYRDFPLESDSALSFKCGTAGNASVLRMVDENGLVVFTSVGIYTNQGALTPENLSMDKRGNYVIDDSVGPISVPGGLMFMDRKTNTARTLSFSFESANYVGEEVSIFSNHLFTGKRVKSWAFQDGNIPLIWVVFNDGSYTSLTFMKEQEMKAWSRHDSVTPVEYVSSITDPTGTVSTLFVTEKDGERFIELAPPRDKVLDIRRQLCMDAAKLTHSYLDITLGETFTVVPVTPGDWEGNLTLTCTGHAFTTPETSDNGVVFRFFDKDGCRVDLTIVQWNSETEVIVSPSSAFPESEAVGFTDIHMTYTVIDGLDHLEGENVTVVVDGDVVTSPNNDQMTDQPVLTVTGGELTLPDGMRGSFIQVGRSFTSDIETLEIATVEQRPVLIESVIVNKLYIKIYDTLGLFVGSKFPKDNKVKGMEDIDTYKCDYEEESEGDVLGNRAEPLRTTRVEVDMGGAWEKQGKICIRQVDPLPFEILSIIPDVEDLRR